MLDAQNIEQTKIALQRVLADVRRLRNKVQQRRPCPFPKHQALLSRKAAKVPRDHGDGPQPALEMMSRGRQSQHGEIELLPFDAAVDLLLIPGTRSFPLVQPDVVD